MDLGGAAHRNPSAKILESDFLVVPLTEFLHQDSRIMDLGGSDRNSSTRILESDFLVVLLTGIPPLGFSNLYS